LLAACGGDLEKFFAKVSAMKDMPPEERRKRLEDGRCLM
jgi:predicted aminopeptidase